MAIKQAREKIQSKSAEANECTVEVSCIEVCNQDLWSQPEPLILPEIPSHQFPTIEDILVGRVSTLFRHSVRPLPPRWNRVGSTTRWAG